VDALAWGLWLLICGVGLSEVLGMRRLRVHEREQGNACATQGMLIEAYVFHLWDIRLFIRAQYGRFAKMWELSFYEERRLCL
jgi:hypothetical protein